MSRFGIRKPLRLNVLISRSEMSTFSAPEGRRVVATGEALRTRGMKRQINSQPRRGDGIRRPSGAEFRRSWVPRVRKASPVATVLRPSGAKNAPPGLSLIDAIAGQLTRRASAPARDRAERSEATLYGMPQPAPGGQGQGG
jgi:hypothetical protein